MEKNQASEMNQFKNPDTEAVKNSLIEDLYRGGPLNESIKRKMRVAVTALLSKEHGADFATDHYWSTCQQIINTQLFYSYPKLFSRVLTEDQVEGVKNKYPLQMQFLESVIKHINEGLNLKMVQSRVGLT